MIAILQHIVWLIYPPLICVTIKGRCEAVVHGIHVTLDVHLKWVVM